MFCFKEADVRFLISIFVLFAAAGLNADISDGLSGAWMFENFASGEVRDYSGNNAAGITKGNPEDCGGYISGGIELDGFDDYINAPSFSMNTQNATFCAWIKTHSIPNWWVSIINTHKASGKCGLAFYKKQNQLAYYWNDSKYSFDSGLEIPLNQWVFTAVVIAPQSAVLYVKPQGGQLAKAVNLDSHSFCTLSGVMIGRDSAPGWGDGERRFDGCIDEVRIYSRSLPESEIIQLSDMSRCWNYPPLVYASDSQIAYLGESKPFACSFEDDGRPFIGGCGDLTQGTSFQKSFLWSKLSGPGSVSFTAPSQQSTEAVFSETGNYQIQIEVSDGPSGVPADIYGKTGSEVIDVDVVSESEKKLAADYRFQQQPDEAAVDSAGLNDWAARLEFGSSFQTHCNAPENGKGVGFMPGEDSVFEIQPQPAGASEISGIKEATVCVWIMPLTVSEGNGKVCFSAKSSSGNTFTLQGSTPLSYSQWHHIAAVYDAVQGQMRIYVNGSLDASAEIPPAALSSEWYEPLIGSGGSGKRENFVGCIDKLQIFNYALSGQEIVSQIECSEFVFAGLNGEADISGRFNLPDCRVNLFDYAMFSENWLTESLSPADFNEDSHTDIADLAVLAENWLFCKDPQDTNCLQHFGF
ncbi:Laminin G domain protein [Sedimentisphaera salicampi]|uniref:Laminin G domain protein n=1 Tax=Sedimentisphaera salicampi TaxID=1941349 RepID=A0A1W6LIT4_9BACT|nr:Laminin G domain protein [Sedimentisphaera salicampi]